MFLHIPLKYSSISNWLYKGKTKLQATTTISQIGNYSQWKMILKLNSFWLAWMFYKCRITKYCEVAFANFLGTHPACSWPLWTLSMCSIYFSCHWAAMSCLKRKCFAKGKIPNTRTVTRWHFISRITFASLFGICCKSKRSTSHWR